MRRSVRGPPTGAGWERGIPRPKGAEARACPGERVPLGPRDPARSRMDAHRQPADRERFAEAVEVARQLVRIPSITGEEGREISEFVASWLWKRGVSASLQEVGAGRFNVVAEVTREQPRPVFLLEGHLDTKWVDGMAIDPFGAQVRDGRLWGRGAADMKSGLAAMMVAMAALQGTDREWRGTVRLCAEVGEEGGGGGAQRLLEAGLLDVDAAVVGEPSGLEVHVGNRGRLLATVCVRGVATHSGTAAAGINAIQKAARVVEALYRLPGLDREDALWGRTSVNVWSIRGGGRWEASVADECTVEVDYRLTPCNPPEELAESLVATLQGLEAEDPELRVDWERTRLRPGGAAVALSPDHPFVRQAVAAVEEVTGVRARVGTCPGATLAGGLLRRGIPAIILGPGRLQEAHSADEWVEVAQIPLAARIYARMATRFLGTAGP